MENVLTVFRTGRQSSWKARDRERDLKHERIAMQHEKLSTGEVDDVTNDWAGHVTRIDL